LIGVDATARSEDAVALGRRLALTGDGRVIVAAVTPADHPQRDEARAAVRRMSGLLLGVLPGRIHTAVVPGRSPAEALHRLAETEHASVLVVGSSHRGRLGRILPGGTGERLLFGSPCAVALAPDGYRAHAAGPVKRVGVAYDGSAESEAAFATALSAAQAHGATFEIITVVPNEVSGVSAFAGVGSYEVVRSQLERTLRNAQREAAAHVPERVPVERVELDGHPPVRLAEHSAQLDLLFVGSRGYGPLHAVIVGGTSSALLRDAQCPVIVLPRGLQTPLAEVFDAAPGPRAEPRA
jgi:nucleotide-binding universal stress UspA family protein